VNATPGALVITGATATGKTGLSIEVARQLDGEIISMDSRQIYRGLDIGTAKPTAVEQAVVPHHGLDLVEPSERYSAGRFAADARRWIAEVKGRGRVPLLVGGTGFFLKALTDPMFAEPELEPQRRDSLRQWLEQQDSAALKHWLAALDPQLSERLAEGGGRQRFLRAIEIALLTGAPLSWWQRHAPSAETGLHTLVFVLELPREELYRRINERVIAMIDAGLVDEVRALVRRGYDERAPGMNATGYQELLSFLRDELDLASAIDAIQRATRRYARRQQTWFRHQLPDSAVRLAADQPRELLVQRITETWKREVQSAHRN
jgi:tRNA dimethylallyltransferase